MGPKAKTKNGAVPQSNSPKTARWAGGKPHLEKNDEKQFTAMGFKAC